ncbi:uncharacterized protein SPAPADRAFT_63296 [Spathaspora passalidarum NRRL Y-27907]|uniref:DnaJ homologue subfamily C member 28 conserved domain-containing protein n=1 Tax=Spathaspora passalidarum (strain NRRL Y-27907 / 11-Y1) TaxID=619300 RepID=G3AU93_SPAPN|nr:uncharacterized protein SPAPADRAFT_63296 [Spathaspora passalidarum NRRL Y-27907]EGW30468.1 hypothetical protein SPAPADRAFT_63296 [Spathaspora passalidarum NRRL Y-27907]
MKSISRQLPQSPQLARVIRYYSNKSPTSGNPTNVNDSNEDAAPHIPPPDEINSAIVERMKQILEDKISTTSNVSAMKSIDSTVHDVFQKYSPEATKIKEAESYIKNEHLLQHNKHARDLYNTPAWQGDESKVDANLRMIIDKTPKPITKSLKDKLTSARDISLDYKLNKEFGVDPKEEDNFREMYKERLLGPTQLLSPHSASVDFVDSLASNKINASINRNGQFDNPEMVNVRGRPLSQEHLKNCTDSNYFMNQILSRQQVLPPWIESQRGLNNQIDKFRSAVDDMWFQWILNRSDMSHIIHTAKTIDQIEDSFVKKVSWFVFRPEDLRDSELSYIKERVNILNKEIRDYNLKCPSTSGHKHKLDIDKEIKDSYWRALEKFPVEIEAWFVKNKLKDKSRPPVSRLEYEASTGTPFLNLWGEEESRKGVHQGPVHEKNADPKLHFWEAIKNIFK